MDSTAAAASTKLVLQSQLRTPAQRLAGAKGYAFAQWKFEEELRRHLAGQGLAAEPTDNLSGQRQALVARMLSGQRQALVARMLSVLCEAVGPSPEMINVLSLSEAQLRPAYDFSLIDVNAQGELCVRQEFAIAPDLCLAMLAKKGCAAAKRYLARQADSGTVTRSTALLFTPVITAAAVTRAEETDMKACAVARRELATSTLETISAILPHTPSC